jgi:hypothetical protein
MRHANLELCESKPIATLSTAVSTAPSSFRMRRRRPRKWSNGCLFLMRGFVLGSVPPNSPTAHPSERRLTAQLPAVRQHAPQCRQKLGGADTLGKANTGTSLMRRSHMFQLRVAGQ